MKYFIKSLRHICISDRNLPDIINTFRDLNILLYKLNTCSSVDVLYKKHIGI